jgi:hypothetical protein
MQHQCDIETVNSEIKNSYDLRSATVASNCGKSTSFKPYISKTPQSAPTPPPKRQ